MRLRGTAVMVGVLILVGCRSQPSPTESLSSMHRGLTQDQVRDLLGDPYLRHDRMWEYRFHDDSQAYVSFDRAGTVTAWITDEMPGLRTGLVPVDAYTHRKLKRGMHKSVIHTLLGDPARRDDTRWFYSAPDNYLLELRFNDSDELDKKLFYRIAETPVAGEEETDGEGMADDEAGTEQEPAAGGAGDEKAVPEEVAPAGNEPQEGSAVETEPQ